MLIIGNRYLDGPSLPGYHLIYVRMQTPGDGPFMKSTLKDIAVWMLLWFCGWGIYYLLLAHDVNYLTSPLVCALYFSAASLTIIVFYRNVFFSTARLVGPASWFMAALSIAAALAVYILLPLFIPAPETLILRNPDMFFLRLDTAYLFSKPFEIVFQQVLIFLLAAHMTRRGLSLPATCLISCLVFGASHLYLIAHNGLMMGGYFTISAACAGLLFPYLILRLQKGLVYTSSIHLLFYVFTGALCRLYPAAFIE